MYTISVCQCGKNKSPSGYAASVVTSGSPGMVRSHYAAASVRVRIGTGRRPRSRAINKRAPCRCGNTDTTLTKAPAKEAPMAVHQRNTASPLTQEPPLTIARVALYARASTCTGQDPEMQLRELREYASRRGWTITSEYVDQGVSGSKESRPQLNQLMADAHRRRFDAVLVWKIDRWGRSLTHLVNSLADLAAYGVAFVSLRDNIGEKSRWTLTACTFAVLRSRRSSTFGNKRRIFLSRPES